MAWDFDTDPEYQKLLDWADGAKRLGVRLPPRRAFGRRAG